MFTSEKERSLLCHWQSLYIKASKSDWRRATELSLTSRKQRTCLKGIVGQSCLERSVDLRGFSGVQDTLHGSPTKDSCRCGVELA